MAPPPTKKQKRVIVLSSDDDSSTEQSLSIAKTQAETIVENTTRIRDKLQNRGQALPTRLKDDAKIEKLKKTRANGSLKAPLTSLSRNNSKAKSSYPKVQEGPRSGSLYTFFNPITTSQRTRNISDASYSKNVIVEDDLIQDDSLDEEIRSWPSAKTSNQDGIDDRKRSRTSSSSYGLEACKEIHQNASQRFSVTGQGNNAAQSTTACSQMDSRPWAEKYAPLNLNDLAVHKKKVAEVQNWLRGALTGQLHEDLLVLRGPAGSGKTATISVLAKLMNFEIVEWRNPFETNSISNDFLSISARFEDFLGRSGKFGSLQLKGQECMAKPVVSNHLRDSINEKPKKIILMEEFPNIFTRTSTALQSFRRSILQYLSVTSSSDKTVIPPYSESHVAPLIMVISETPTTSTTAATDSFTAHRLLGLEILMHPGTRVIEFNPVAPTFLTKALNLVMQKEACRYGRRRILGTGLLQKLGEGGDMRSAIGSLEFLYIRDDAETHWSGMVTAKLKKGMKDQTKSTKAEQESIELITQREATLGLFHAVGKVIYNKRDEAIETKSSSSFSTQPPGHLSHFARPRCSQVSVDQLNDETGTDIQTFISALHENYVLSCDGPFFTNSIIGCIEALSDSDILGSIGNYRSCTTGMQRSSGGVSSSQNDGNNNLCFDVAVRGLLFALPYPVKRRAAPMKLGDRGNSRVDNFKIFYPTALKLWKQQEEIESLIDRWRVVSKGQNEVREIDTLLSPAELGIVESWSKTQLNFSAEPSPGQNLAAPSTICGCSARLEMILERLPYIAKIKYQSKELRWMGEVEKMTQFRGIDASTDNTPETDNGEDDAAVSTDMVKRHIEYQENIDRTDPTNMAWRKQDFDPAIRPGKSMQKLVPSDDDIEG